MKRYITILFVPIRNSIDVVSVLTLALVLPAEAVFLPNVCEALAADVFLNALLVGEPFPFRIDRGGRGLIEDVAKVEEVFLTGGPLFELGGAPFVDELLRRHGSSLGGKACGRSVAEDWSGRNLFTTQRRVFPIGKLRLPVGKGRLLAGEFLVFGGSAVPRECG